MQLSKKKALAAKVLCVGKNKIIFINESLAEIKEAITRQDIMDLYKSGAIQIKDVSGRKKIVKRKHRRGMGKIKKRVNKSKQDYVKLTRKLRAIAKNMNKRDKMDKETHKEVRKMIRASKFKSKRHMLESVEEMKK